MKPRSPLPPLFAVALAFALAACGPKRPPVSATAPGARPAPSATPAPASEPIEPGPDVQPLGAEGPDATDIALASEQGPLVDIHFAFDQASLDDEARAILEKHALWLQSHRQYRLRVEGHCDERGTVEYNLALGEQRARAAREYLVSLGVAAERLVAVSLGKERPLDPGHDEEAWRKNRRAHFVVLR